jgi:hypothetical protein
MIEGFVGKRFLTALLAAVSVGAGILTREICLEHSPFLAY